MFLSARGPLPDRINASRPAHSAPLSSERVVAFDGLRGVCAMMVLAHHMLLTQAVFANTEWNLPRTGEHGTVEWLLIDTPLRLVWAGQERAILFFVLSGFVLSLPWLDGRPAGYGRYLLGRFCRIYPPYLAAMVIAAAGSVLLGGHALPEASLYVRTLGWVFEPGWAAVPSVALVMNTHASEYMNEAIWSLVWEVRVAFILPVLAFAAARWGNRALLPLLALLVVLGHGANMVLGPDLSRALNWPGDTFHFAEFFLLGVAVAVNRRRIAALAHRGGGWLGVLLLGSGCLIAWAPWPVEHERMIGLGAAVILAAVLASARVQAWLSIRPLLWLGRQSYSLYLLHVPIIMAAVALGGGVLPVWWFPVVTAAVIVAAEIFRRHVEMPTVAFTQRLTGYRRRPERSGARTVSFRPLGRHDGTVFR